MKVTVRQLRGRPRNNSWHPLLEQLKETGISKFLIDVKTDNLDDFFQHVGKYQFEKKKENFIFNFQAKTVGLVGPYYDFVLTSLVNKIPKTNFFCLSYCF
jgi:hypothetical protein